MFIMFISYGYKRVLQAVWRIPAHVFTIMVDEYVYYTYYESL